MLHSVPRLALCSAIVLTAACNEENVNAPETAESAALHAMRPPHGRPSTSHAPVVTFADPDDVVGRSVLHRASAGVRVRLASRDLEPGTAVTLWWVIFNEPGACDGPCDEPDLFVDEVKADVLYADGTVIAASGRGTFRAKRRVGDANESLWALFGLPSYGLLDPQKAVIHFVLRSHGPVIDELVADMITTFNGGCGGLGEEFGAPGPNTCEDIQFSVHEPQ